MKILARFRLIGNTVALYLVKGNLILSNFLIDQVITTQHRIATTSVKAAPAHLKPTEHRNVIVKKTNKPQSMLPIGKRKWGVVLLN